MVGKILIGALGALVIGGAGLATAPAASAGPYCDFFDLAGLCDVRDAVKACDAYPQACAEYTPPTVSPSPRQYAPPPTADGDVNSYVQILEQAELIVADGDPKYEFSDGDSAAFTGDWVCQQVAQGRSRDSVVDDLNHSDGMLLSPQDSAVIFDAATTYLC